MEFLVELLLDCMVQLVVEICFELGLRVVAEPFAKPPNPWIAAVGYACFGVMFGGLSVWLLPRHLVTHSEWRVINLIVTPVCVGLCMAGLGAWRSRRGQTLLRIDRFSYGYLFALSFAMARFLWAH